MILNINDYWGEINMDYDYQELSRKSFFSGGYDAYNYPLRLINGPEDFLDGIYAVEKTNEEIGYLSFIIFTEKQYIFSSTGYDDSGSHNVAIARAWADINGYGKFENYMDVSKTYKDAENRLLMVKLYCERSVHYGKIANLFVFHSRSDKKISQKEYDSVMAYLDEYSYILKEKHFKFNICGKECSYEECVLRLKSMIDPNLDLSEILPKKEKIIGILNGDEKLVKN